MVWFRCDVGRRKKADPKWLLPAICRVGGVTKRDIGAIRIFDHETRFEIGADVADAFAAAIGAGTNSEMRIEPAGHQPGTAAEDFGRGRKEGRFGKSPSRIKAHAPPRRGGKARKAG